MQDKLTQNKKLKPRSLSCSFFIRHFWFLDTRKDNDTDRKLGFALLIDLEWWFIGYNKKIFFRGENSISYRNNREDVVIFWQDGRFSRKGKSKTASLLR